MLALLLALGTLAKGPLGVAVPLFVILLFLALQRDLVFLKKLPLAAGATLFLLVASSWYGLAFSGSFRCKDERSIAETECPRKVDRDRSDDTTPQQRVKTTHPLSKPNAAGFSLFQQRPPRWIN